jgi:superfamily II DNA/RNA helicase
MLILCLSQMRMVCDSTFILDQHSRHDTKIDELIYIFEEALADPLQKIVIFSQWERMTRLVAQELEARDIGFANLHGGVPSIERQGLLQRFQNDPECRIFLSTDAGGVGLNLQAASIVINLDIPWNPAILEQRIARVYRMGQENTVTVINMVAMETIEHRMLGVLDFKSGMAQGVLDPDGDDTIFMSETKFKKLMENVETLTETSWPEPSDALGEAPQTTEMEDFESPPMPTAAREDSHPAIPESTYSGDDDIKTEASAQGQPAPAAPSPAPTPLTNEPNTGNSGQSGMVKAPRTAPEASREAGGTAVPASPQELVQTGVSFLSGLAQTLSSPEKTRELVESIVAKDEQSGQSYLKIPVESAAVVENALKLLGGLFGNLGK